MLVAQAKRSAELFTGSDIPDSRIAQICSALSRDMENIVLVGMPSSGKSSLGRLLAERLGRPLYESDVWVEEAAAMPISHIFESQGEEVFRRLETRALEDLGKLSGAVISTGGGCVTRPENYPLLHQNGRILWLRRSTDKLEKTGRPISLSTDLDELYRRREPLYRAFADLEISNDGSLEEALERALEVLR